jgi:fermentation-respiration switch protein FrsA (DUF1100 family)
VVLVEKLNINGIPSLHIVDERYVLEKLPLVIFVHGFTSAKENNLHYAYLLAEKGIRVVLPEALFHGERQNGLNQKELAFHFWDIVLSTIDELNDVKVYFESKGLIDVERIGLAGTSMGGIITFGALTKYSWINSAVSLMGAPYYQSFAQLQIEEMKKRGIKLPFSDKEQNQLLEKLKQYDLSLQPEKLGNRPLFLWHGRVDQVVPFEYSRKFYDTIKNQYHQVEFMADEKAGHQVSREGLLKTVKWFETNLKLQVSTPK